MTDLSDLVAEGRRLHEFARMADAFPQRVTTGADLGVWSRNNLPALLDEAEKVPTLEAEVERLQAEHEEMRSLLGDYPRDLFAARGEASALRGMKHMAEAEIARLREALETIGRSDDPGYRGAAEMVRIARAALAVVEEPK